ncbi:MAG: hypothetical protein HS104_13295 [Polyangiaceae bacterium]|nr:hypothetical protein [Polyangiaceae bacterium]MCE7890009.1 hypothetical protein [Sorangiineae bacterium PRO1]MCL4752314.1 hypothetical protein [Myxococcales bacterium]
MSGPIEDGVWPDQLTAHVTDSGSEPRLHGYAVESDLAVHYSFPELCLLALTGELPSERQAHAFGVALSFLSGASVAEAPLHAARLSRVCGATSSGTIGVAAIGLAEQARHLLAEHAELLAWLGGDTGPFPERHLATSAREVASVERLGAALGEPVRGLCENPSRRAALICVLWSAGLRSPASLELAWTLARLPVTFAEARAVAPASLRDYPMNTPPFVYEPPT